MRFLGIERAGPGTRMPFAGVKKPDDVVNLAAFLKQYRADGSKI